MDIQPQLSSGFVLGAAKRTSSALEVCTMSWILWASTVQGDSSVVHEEIDKIFTGHFSFYPEKEWRAAGFPPPEGHEVLGAWRDPSFAGFAFLMNNPGMKAPPGTIPHLLTYDGARTQVAPFIPKIDHLKKTLSLDKAKKKSNQKLRTRLRQADIAASFRRLMILMGSVTAVINAIALYLRKLPAPTIHNERLAEFYNDLIPSVYISALLLLLLFVGIFFIFTTKYAMLLIRRL
jgi:hypothetical protein